MTVMPRNGTKAPARRRGVAALCAGFVGLGFLYPTPYGIDNADHGPWSPMAFGVRAAHAQGAPASNLQNVATGAMAAFKATEPPAPVEGIEIVDATGKSRPLSDWKGRVVLLNLWATWCAPCLKEMPALDKLKAETGSPAFDVIALNIDKTPEKPHEICRG